MYQVVIIEDNPMVAAIDQTYVEQNRELTVAAVFSDAESALDYFLTHTADLVILDYYLPGMDGQGFMSRFRAAGHTADVIMVTAASDAENVTKLSAFGLLDYLVKPFQYPRFQMAVERFLERRSLLCGSGAQAQSTLDRVFLSQQGSEFLPVEKGIQPATLDRIRVFLRQQQGRPLSIEAISESVGLSRVTVRRYMNRLLALHEVNDSVDYSTGGRPSTIYTYLG